MRRQVAAEWTGFAAGLMIAAVVWMWVHPSYGWSKGMLVSAKSAKAEQTKQLVGKSDGKEPSVNIAAVQMNEKNALSGIAAKKPDGEGRAGAEGQPVGERLAGVKEQPDGDGPAGIERQPFEGVQINDKGQPIIKARTSVEEQRDVNAGSGKISLNSADSPTQPNKQAPTQTPQLELPKTVNVYLTEENRIETVPLEIYVRGVVAAEMPSDFHPAALEAQALAARTYIVRRLLKQDDSNVPVPGADVTDTETHQVYRSLKEMNRLRTVNEEAWRKYDQAAARTANQIITYKNEPIQALYFSTSNGYTENSEDVFPHLIPYLRSVASPWDEKHSPRAKETVKLPLKEFYEKLGVRTIPAIAAIKGFPRLQVKEWTEGKRVKTLALGGKTISGVEVREKLGLRSASFNWSIEGGEIAITTYGSGHGVGMSQWGAEGMAQAGFTAEEIIHHYYTGVELLEVKVKRS